MQAFILPVSPRIGIYPADYPLTSRTRCQPENPIAARFMRFSMAILMILVASLVTPGCARWESAEKKSGALFPKSRIPLDAVGLELGIAQLDSRQVESFESFWRLLDQQALPLELRQRLDQNGLRAAIMQHAPAVLHELVDPQPIVVDELTKLEKLLHAKGLLREKKRMIAHERISNREGEPHSISISEFHPQVSWVVRDGDSETPGYGQSVRGAITVTTYPQGDGSVRLVFEPEIHHGQTRPQMAERSFLKEARQAVLRFEEIRFEVTLRPGESIVVAPTADIADLGRLFFGAAEGSLETEGPSNRTVPTHRMLLVRVVQTQMDDLFSGGNQLEKLSTISSH